MARVINFLDKFSSFDDLWSPKVIAEMNDYQFKLVKIKGEFVKDWSKNCTSFNLRASDSYLGQNWMFPFQIPLHRTNAGSPFLF